MFKAVFFNLDDTLISFDGTSGISWLQVCREYYKENHDVQAHRIKKKVDETRKWFWSDEDRHRRGRNDLAEDRRTIVRKAFAELRLPKVDAVKVADSHSKIRLENVYLSEDTETVLQNPPLLIPATDNLPIKFLCNPTNRLAHQSFGSLSLSP